VQLAYSLTGTGTDPQRVLILVHGIMGSGRNWAGWARRLASQWPAWRFMTVDLRHHGESVGAVSPDDLDACAVDLEETVVAAGVRPSIAVGHSFGGKVVLAWTGRAPQGLRQAWVLDASPFAVGDGPLDVEVVGVVRAVAEMPGPFGSFEEVRDAFLARGFSSMLAGWMTTNLRREGAALVWRFNLDGVKAMLRSYVDTDLAWVWERGAARIDLVLGGRSSRWSAGAVEELVALAGPDHVHVLPDAGHWLHVDDPDGLLALLSGALADADGGGTAGR